MNLYTSFSTYSFVGRIGIIDTKVNILVLSKVVCCLCPFLSFDIYRIVHRIVMITMQDEYLDDLSHLQFQDARLVCWSLRNPSFLVHLEARQILDLHLISLTIFIHT